MELRPLADRTINEISPCGAGVVPPREIGFDGHCDFVRESGVAEGAENRLTPKHDDVAITSNGCRSADDVGELLSVHRVRELLRQLAMMAARSSSARRPANGEFWRISRPRSDGSVSVKSNVSRGPSSNRDHSSSHSWA